MKERNFNLHDGEMGAAITVSVVPKASRNELSEILDDGTLKIRLVTTPNEERGNHTLIHFLAEILDVKPAQIEIVGGLMGKDKLITIMQLNREMVQERVLRYYSQHQS